ncbi:hypothetical protein EUA06_02710 [Nocardioides glacieisoli]|uniref:Uncharacterized protein n=1 Tax=Nocardioides glacieisoli TaxID=1168730 RepID=A0A4Q2S7W3_9ACTN|nr:hypothetical protein [Nocardioides glacieisoli]RYB96499.1 hypothetical protein EUA06_02710 [Nocardioides glacieisoli]
MNARLVRLIQDQRLRAVGEEPVEPVEVDLGTLGRGRHLEQVLDATGDVGQPVLGVVAGRREDHSAGPAEDVDREADARRHVNDGADRRGLRRPPEVPSGPADVGLGELGVVVERVAGDADGERPLDGLHHHRVDCIVHLRDPRGDHVVGHRAPLQRQRAARLLVGEVDDRAALGGAHEAQTCSRDATAAATLSIASATGTPLSWRPSR